MSLNRKNSIDAAEAELEHVLRNFRESAVAWSDAEYGRPRSLAPVAQLHPAWRLAAAWALGSALAIGSLTAGLYEHHHRQELARMDTHRQQQRTPAANGISSASVDAAPVEQVAQVQVPQEDENLLDTVDSDVSRQVPSAMEPLAQLMETSANR